MDRTFCYDMIDVCDGEGIYNLNISAVDETIDEYENMSLEEVVCYIYEHCDCDDTVIRFDRGDELSRMTGLAFLIKNRNVERIRKTIEDLCGNFSDVFALSDNTYNIYLPFETVSQSPIIINLYLKDNEVYMRLPRFWSESAWDYAGKRHHLELKADYIEIKVCYFLHSFVQIFTIATLANEAERMSYDWRNYRE